MDVQASGAGLRSLTATFVRGSFIRTHRNHLVLSKDSACSQPRRSVVVRRRRAAVPRAEVTPNIAPLHAKEHRTGEKLVLVPATDSNRPTITRFIVCPGCKVAYVGNAVTRPAQVLCPACKNKFSTSPKQLYVRFDTETDVFANRPLNAPSSPTSAAPKDNSQISCRHFAKCPGCTIEKDVLHPPILQEISVFADRALRYRREISIDMLSSTEWRTHAKLAIRANGVGLFRMRSHEVVAIPECVVHHPRINEAVKALERALFTTKAKAYDEDTGSGGPRYALFTVERHSGLVQVTIVWNASSWKHAHPYASRVGSELWNSNKSLLHSVWFNWNTSRGNVILSSREQAFYLMHGQPSVNEVIRGVEIPFVPSVFRQANIDAFEKLLLPKLLSYIPPRSSIVELFAGVGVISLAALAEPGLNPTSVICTEINEFAEGPFKKALRRLRVPSATPVSFIVGSDNETVEEAVHGDADLVIVDPPRAGMSDYCVSQLADAEGNRSLKRLIYVSCGFEGFKRDSLRLLEGSSRWSLRALHGFIFFPGSNHVELLAVFDRQA